MQLPIIGAYESGYPEIDQSLCFVPYDLLRKIHPENPGMIGIKLVDPYDQQSIDRIRARYGDLFTVMDWREQIRPLYAALMLEKRSMQILLFLIFMIIAVNIKHSLDRLIIVKKEEIGIMYAGGASKANIISVFFLQNIFLTSVGLVFGISLGYLAAYNVNEIFTIGVAIYEIITGSIGQFRLIELPVEIRHSETLLVSLGVFVLTFMATGLSVMRILRLNPVEILRYE